MANLYKAVEVNEKLKKDIINDVEDLKKEGVSPKLAIIRVGERDDDVYYEKNAIKKCDSVGVHVKTFALDANISEDDLVDVIKTVNDDDNIHGVLLFRPLPKHIDEDYVCNCLDTKKDIDGITDASLAGIFANKNVGFPPCTAAACIEILNHYNVSLTGKNVVIVGRSLVVGKPLSMMLLKENATITICHTKTKNMEEICKNAEILIVAAGVARVLNEKFVSANQTVIDVGINVDENGKLCGDVDFDAVCDVVSNITPVPGGVGGVTTTVLVKQVVMAAKKSL